MVSHWGLRARSAPTSPKKKTNKQSKRTNKQAKQTNKQTNKQRNKANEKSETKMNARVLKQDPHTHTQSSKERYLI